MQIFATFEYSMKLEIAVSELKVNGIKDIYAVPLNLRKQEPKLMDSIHRADGLSFFDKGMILAFMVSTIGASRGYVWPGGPIIWGLAGALLGFLIGVLVNWVQYLLKRKKTQTEIQRGKKGEVILIVTCEDTQTETVEAILWGHKALGLAKTN